MKSISTLALLVVPFVAGCGFLMPPAAKEPATSEPAVTEEQKTFLRAQEEAAAKAEAANDPVLERLQRDEKDLGKAIKISLGREAMNPGMPLPDSASKTVATLRAAKIKLRIEPVLDRDGHPVNDNFLQAKDSLTDRVMVISKKLGDGTATAAEKKEIQANGKYLGRLTDLKLQLGSVSLAAIQTNTAAQTESMTTMARVSNLVRTRKQMEMAITAEDYAKVQGWLVRGKRVQNVAATSMALLATYQAVLNDEANPKALDVLGEAALKDLGATPTVSEQEAKDYVKNLQANAAAVKVSYEKAMRKVYGDARYEAQHKASIDAMFQQFASAESQKSVTELAKDAGQKYRADLERCGRGEAISPGSTVGPTHCKQARAAKLRGEPIPMTVEASHAGESSGGGLGGLLSGAIASIPGLNVVTASLEGIHALAKGDAKGALRAAIALAPGGGLLKEGLATVEKVLSEPIPTSVAIPLPTKG